jgi:hypothetical protein
VGVQGTFGFISESRCSGHDTASNRKNTLDSDEMIVKPDSLFVHRLKHRGNAGPRKHGSFCRAIFFRIFDAGGLK